jgi:hypothetical protein
VTERDARSAQQSFGIGSDISFCFKEIDRAHRKNSPVLHPMFTVPSVAEK